MRTIALHSRRLNPIEKLWRLTKQSVTHMHHRATQWPELRADTRAFLNHFPTASLNLLRYVGLSPHRKAQTSSPIFLFPSGWAGPRRRR